MLESVFADSVIGSDVWYSFVDCWNLWKENQGL